MAKEATRRNTAKRSQTPPSVGTPSAINMRNIRIAAIRALERIEGRAGLTLPQIIELRQALLNHAIEEFRTSQQVLKPLPQQAPELWSGRSKNENPYMFLGRVYGPWLDHGLTMAHIRSLDRKLYQAFAVWHHRHSGPKDPREPKPDPIQALRAAIQRSKEDQGM